MSTVTLSLELSSGNLLLGKKLILTRSCLSCALWIGPNRIPPNSKFQTASHALLPNTRVAFPGYPHDFALLPTCWPSHQHWEHFREPSKVRTTRGGGAWSAESRSVFMILLLLSLKPPKPPIFRGAPSVSFSYVQRVGLCGGCISLWGWGAEDVGVPLPLQLRLWVLQEWFGEGKLSFFFFFFFPLLHEAKTTGPGEGQLQIPLLAKSNYKLYP